MKIGVDISQIAHRGSGVASYTEALIEALLRHTEHDYTFFYSSLRQQLPNTVKESLHHHDVKNYRIPPTVLEFMWNKVHVLPIERFIGQQDLVITSDWTEPPVKKAHKITTIHDLVYAKFPQTTTQETDINLNKLQISPNIVATQKRRLEWVKREATLIMCDSLSTKHDAEEILHIEPNRLRVVYPGIKPPRELGDKEEMYETKYMHAKPYILAVGKLEPRKNLQRLINAYLSLQSKIPDIELCIVGAQGWGDSIQHRSPTIKFLGYVDDLELSYLYRKALCFVMPSLYEGFGYPVVEAMLHGTPVAASNTSSLSEIVANNGLQFNPLSTEDIAEKILTLVENKSLREALRSKGYRRAQDFSMENFAKNLFSVISDAV